MHIIQFFTRRQWVGLGLLLAVILAVYFNTWLSLWPRWNTRGEAYSHAYLLMLIAVGLGIRQRSKFLAAPARRGWVAIPLLLGASLIWLIGNLTQIGILQQITLPAIPFFTIWACVGFAAASTLLFPFAILYTVIPFWDFLVPYLQDFTVKVASTLLAVFTIPAFISEHYIQLPAGTLQVAEGCAGMSYLLISITLAMIYAYLAKLAWRRALALLGVGVLLGLATNWLRVFGIAMIAYYSEMQSSIVKDHELFGWAVFAGCLVPFFLAARALESTTSNSGDPVRAAENQAVDTSHFSLRQPLLASAITGLLGPMIALLLESLPTQTISTNLPDRLEGAFTQTEPLPVPLWAPDYQGADSVLQQSYVFDGRYATVHLITYLTQSQGRELINWRNQLVNTDQWKITDERITDGMLQTVITNPALTESYRIYSWFDVGGYVTTSGLRAKLLELPAVLQLRKDASLVAIAFKCQQLGCPEQQTQQDWVKTVQKNAHATLIKGHP